MVGIYLIKSPSDAVYIGQSWDIEARHRWYKSHNENEQPYLSNSFKKYGFDSHEIKILHELPNDVEQGVLDRYEQIYIDAYRDSGFKLMNVKEGGRGGKHSDESKRKMAEWQLGRKKSDTHRKNISAAQLGRKNSPERIANMVKGRSKHFKPVLQFDKVGNFIKRWDCGADAARELNIHHPAISQCLLGKVNKAGGFKWKYC